jgi:putative ABC transport system permease protein
MLVGVSMIDGWTLAAVAVVLASVALAASALPARRATALDPTRALRAGN